MTLINQGVSCLINQSQSINYGETAVIRVPLLDGDSQPITPSGYAIDFQVRAGYTSSPVIALDETSPYITTSEGLIEIYLNSSATQLNIGDYIMGCRINDNDTQPTIVDVYAGNLTIKHGPVQ